MCKLAHGHDSIHWFHIKKLFEAVPVQISAEFLQTCEMF